MNKISIASRRKKHQVFPKSSEKKIAVIPRNWQTQSRKTQHGSHGIHTEYTESKVENLSSTEVKFEFTKEEFVELFSNINKTLSQQKQIQFSVTLTQTNANKIKIDVNSQPNGDSSVGDLYSTILTSDEVCDILKIRRSFLHKYARMGVIPGLKIGRKWRFEVDSIFKLFGET